MRIYIICGDVVKLADTQDLGSCAERCAGSIPVIPTMFFFRTAYKGTLAFILLETSA